MQARLLLEDPLSRERRPSKKVLLRKRRHCCAWRAVARCSQAVKTIIVVKPRAWRGQIFNKTYTPV